jgi:hypothetical protein
MCHVAALQAMQHNGSAFAHVFLARSGSSPNPAAAEFNEADTWSFVGHRAPPSCATHARVASALREAVLECGRGGAKLAEGGDKWIGKQRQLRAPSPD